jgi:hypothetical protein
MIKNVAANRIPLTVATDLVKRFTNDTQIGWNLPAALSLVLPAQHQHGERVKREAPDHSKRIRFAQRDHIAPAGDDGEQLHNGNEVHDAVAGAEFAMRAAEPIGQHPILGNAHKHAGGADDRSVDGAGKDEKADQNHKHPEDNPQHLRANHIHGHPGDQVVSVNRHPHGVGNEHDRQQGTEAGKKKAVDGDDDRRTFQVLELGMFDLPVHLGQSLFAAHGKNGMSERHDDAEQAQRRGQTGVSQKPQGIVTEVQCRRCGPGRQLCA